MTDLNACEQQYAFSFTEAKEGLVELASSRNGPLNHLSVSRLRMGRDNGDFSADTGHHEVVVHVLVGTCSVQTSNDLSQDSFANIGQRFDVFGGLSESLLLSPNTSYTISPVSKTVDIVISQVDWESPPYPPAIVRQSDVDVRHIGEAHFQREVRVVLGGDSPARKLRVGETINGVGLWSSWPHHSFDVRRDLYADFEEVFLYFIKPKESYALQRIDGVFCTRRTVDSAFAVKNGDWAIMPLGNHPLVSAPDSQVFYFWTYISPIPKIYAKWAEDQGGYA